MNNETSQNDFLTTVLARIFQVIIDKQHNADEKIVILKELFKILGVTEEGIE